MKVAAQRGVTPKQKDIALTLLPGNCITVEERAEAKARRAAERKARSERMRALARRRPTTLIAWLRRQGGISPESAKTWPGDRRELRRARLVSRRGGQWSYLAQAARDFMPTNTDDVEATFVELVEDSIGGTKVYRPEDVARMRMAEPDTREPRPRRKANPSQLLVVHNPSTARRELSPAAAAFFAEFHAMAPAALHAIPDDLDQVGMGELVAIVYLPSKGSQREGDRRPYEHQFRRGAKLAVRVGKDGKAKPCPHCGTLLVCRPGRRPFDVDPSRGIIG